MVGRRRIEMVKIDPRVLLINQLRTQKPTPLTPRDRRYLEVMRREAEKARTKAKLKN